MPMLSARVVIQGKRPLLWHHFTPEAMQAAGDRRERTGTKGNDPTEWQRSVLLTREGQLYVEPMAVFSCIRDAGRHTRNGKGSLQPLLAATIQILNEQVLVDRFLRNDGGPLSNSPDSEVYLDIRMVRNPNTRGRNVRYRVATSPGWKAVFDVMWDASVISREQLRAVLIDAGALVGIGDARSIGFGRFDVVEVTIAERPALATRTRAKEGQARASQ
jgi:hypothetical protein